MGLFTPYSGHTMFDPNAYRKSRANVSGAADVVLDDIAPALADRETLRLWQEGIASPQVGSDAYSSFTGFKAPMVERAAVEAQEASTNTRRYPENIVEQVLGSQQVQDYANGLGLDETDNLHLRRYGGTFMRNQAKKASRPYMGSRSGMSP